MEKNNQEESSWASLIKNSINIIDGNNIKELKTKYLISGTHVYIIKENGKRKKIISEYSTYVNKNDTIKINDEERIIKEDIVLTKAIDGNIHPIKIDTIEKVIIEAKTEYLNTISKLDINGYIESSEREMKGKINELEQKVEKEIKNIKEKIREESIDIRDTIRTSEESIKNLLR